MSTGNEKSGKPQVLNTQTQDTHKEESDFLEDRPNVVVDSPNTTQIQNVAPTPKETHFGMRKANEAQVKPRATGSRYKSFDIFLCTLKLAQVPIENSDKFRTVITEFTVGDRVRGGVKIEPYLVYGSKQFNTLGYNDNIVSDMGIPVQLYFPSGTVKENERYSAGTIEIWVNSSSNGKDNIYKRTFNIFQYKGSPSLKEMATTIRNEWEYQFPGQL